MTHKTLPTDSATVAIYALARQKMAAGEKVFDLCVGEPKLLPHPLIIDGVMQALAEGQTGYPPVSGLPELKQLATTWMNETYDCRFTTEQSLVVNGGKLGIYLLLQWLLSPGDEVLISSPYWVSYPGITELFDGVPNIMQTSAACYWKLTPQQLEDACSARSKILFLNNGVNPTGTLYTKAELGALLKVAHQHDLWVISDEVYSGLTYDDNTYVSCGQWPEYQQKTIVIQSCSKNFSMTGWRVGFVFGPSEIIKPLTLLLGQCTSGASTVSQWAAVAAFKQVDAVNHWVREAMQQRRDVFVQALQDSFDLKISPPQSSLYGFIALQDLGFGHMMSTAFCELALRQANVALVPGLAFGQEGYVRFSFGGDTQAIIDGVAALAALRGSYGCT